MSVNVYDKTTGDLQPLTSMFASPAIIDVEELPSIGIEDVIYRLASDSWSFRGLELSAVDMTVNTASFEAIGCTTATSGGIYTYTPNTYYIRYWGCNEAYAVSNIQIDSADGAMVITGTNGETLLQTTIETGSPYPFYISQKWASVSATLSHTNMSANITALTGIGFAYSTDNTTYVYTPQNCRFKYNGSLVSKIVIASTDGNMKIYDDANAVIYDHVIVDGPYSFMKASSVTYWVGNSQTNKLEQIATIADISSFSSVSSLQDIFNTNPEQNVSGAGNVMSFSNAGKKTTIKSDSIEVSHNESGTQKSDFKVNATKISMSDILLNALKHDLGVYDVEAMGATVETDDTAVSKNYIAGDLLVNDDTLYRATAVISVGDPIVKTGAGANVEHVTFEELLNLKQNKALSAAMTIDGVSASTVEAALTTLNTKKLNVSLKGAASGLAELDAAGKVPEGQLPSYVDDVIEGYLKNSTEFYLHKTVSYDAVTPAGTENPSEEGWYEYDGTEYVPTTDTTVDPSKTYYEKVETYTDKVTNESGKIYIDLETEKSYRWGGTFFVNTGSPLALGETSDTAYRGDRGKIAYDDSQLNKAAIAKLLADISESEEETAIHEHAIGDYLLLNDELQVAIAAIEIGDTLVENTNIRPITIDEALKNLRIDVDKKQNYIFRGTHDEWDALTTEQKAVYDLVAFSDDICVDGDAYISGTVASGDFNAVSSDGVYNATKAYGWSRDRGKQIGSNDDLNGIIEGGYYLWFYGSTPAHVPTNNSAIMQVIPGTGGTNKNEAHQIVYTAQYNYRWERRSTGVDSSGNILWTDWVNTYVESSISTVSRYGAKLYSAQSGTITFKAAKGYHFGFLFVTYQGVLVYGSIDSGGNVRSALSNIANYITVTSYDTNYWQVSINVGSWYFQCPILCYDISLS